MPKQSTIIDTVNRYLKKQNKLTFELNRNGICGGLAPLFVTYSLRKQQHVFFEYCRQLASPELLQNPISRELQQFIVEIELEFNRVEYQQRQSNAGNLEDTARIDNLPIRKEFTVGLVSEFTTWESLLKDVNHERRFGVFLSLDHAIAVEFCKTHVEIYDPNYDEDEGIDGFINKNNTRIFTSENELLQELHQQFFYKSKTLTGFSLMVYAHPNDNTHPSYPNKNQLYRSHLDSTEKCQRSIDEGKENNTFRFAAYAADQDFLNFCIDHQLGSPVDWPNYFFNPKFNAILKKGYLRVSADDQKNYLHLSASAGNFELTQWILSQFPSHKTTDELLEDTALSLSIDCFDFILRQCSHLPIQPTAMEKVFKNLMQYGVSDMLKRFIKEKGVPHTPELLNELIEMALTKPLTKLATLLTLTSSSHHQVNIALTDDISTQHIALLLKHNVVFQEKARRSLLERYEVDSFKQWAKQYSPHWNHFLTQMEQNQIPSNIDLFEEQEGITAFELLCRFQRTDTIQQCWQKQHTIPANAHPIQTAVRHINPELVSFLLQKGCTLSTQELISLLEHHLKRYQFEGVKAVLQIPLEPTSFFVKDNKTVVELIRQGFVEPIETHWTSIEPHLRKMYLSQAIKCKNKQMIQYIYKIDEKLCYALLIHKLKSNTPSSLKEAFLINAASNNQLIEQFIHKNPPIYKEQGTDDKTCTINATLLNFSQFCILNNAFEAADSLIHQLALPKEYLISLYQKAYSQNNTEAVSYLLSRFNRLKMSPEVYFQLQNDGHEPLLLRLLDENVYRDETMLRTLLKRAIEKNSTRVIQTLGPMVTKAYKPEGSPLYYALKNGHTEAAATLIKAGEKSDSFLVDELAWNSAKHAVSNSLFEALFHTLSEQGRIQCVEDALKSDDLPFFKRIYAIAPSLIEPSSCFEKACDVQALCIANELLAFGKQLTFKKPIESLLNALFRDPKTPTPKTPTVFDANSLYQRLFDANLNRLYEFAIDQKYRPFASLHHTIESIVFDSSLLRQSKSRRRQSESNQPDDLRTKLIKNAYQTKSRQELALLFLQLVDNESSLKPHGSKILSYFESSENKAILFRTLPKAQILRLALDEHRMDYVLETLDGLNISDIPQTLIDELSQQSDVLFKALRTRSKTDIQHQKDPRPWLNDLLIPSKKLALSFAFSQHTTAIEDLIMEMEKEMSDMKMDLGGRFYDFELKRKLKADEHIYLSITNQMNSFVEGISTHTPLAQKANAKAIYQQLHDEGYRIEDFEQTGLDFQTHARKNSIRFLTDYIEKRKTEWRWGDFFPFLAWRGKEKINAAQHLMNALTHEDKLLSNRDKVLLSEGRLKEAAFQACDITNPQGFETLNATHAKNALDRLLTDYIEARTQGKETYHALMTSAQFTKTTKIEAARKLKEGEANALTPAEKNALNQGHLGRTLSLFFKAHGKELTGSPCRSVTSYLKQR